MEFDEEIVKFNVYNAISHPSEILSAPELELEPARKARKLDIQELEEIHNDAYKNAHLYKEKTKLFHDKRIAQKHFLVSFNHDGNDLFIVAKVFTHGDIEIESEESRKQFVVNGQWLKPFYENFQSHTVEKIHLEPP
ncbi:uncharacterized protein LOC105781542 [Gossypium raimondii]|uniref:uncharacterized protein LOC105781542 n=1 Tax=Gossypium raimondii TaxID=29730 RepID=UPI00227C5EC3|nr:uncharacterized protein LOC105781542 [Gossypium raimondii]